MSGHSKWSKVKHQKESKDASKGKIFTKLSNIIAMAVKEGGGNSDPDSNFKLRLAIEKARSLNMPKDKIERAIERGKGKGGELNNFQEAVYEAFGPAGVGIIIETASDNKQRTVANIKSILDREGGSLASAGSVMHNFQFAGLIKINKTHNYDQVMEAALDTGAYDLEDSPDSIEVYTDPALLHKIKQALEAKGITVDSFELFYRAKTTISVTNKEIAQKIIQLMQTLEDLDDVKCVFANFEIPDEYLN